MTDYTIERAVGDDALFVAAHLRPQDLQELAATSGLAPEVSLLRSLEVSRDTNVGKIDGRPACLFGVYSPTVLTAHGHPWFYGTTLLEGHERAFLRRCRPWVAEMGQRYGTLLNWVDARNRKAILWLRWLGFDVDEATIPAGPHGLPFHPYRYEGAK